LEQEDFDTLTVCAFRYALGRRTYIVGDVARIVAQGRSKVSPEIRNIIVRDLKEAIDRDDYAREQGRTDALPLGMDCDRKEWVRLYDLLRDEG
jgi:hypothetical protein